MSTLCSSLLFTTSKITIIWVTVLNLANLSPLTYSHECEAIPQQFIVVYTHWPTFLSQDAGIHGMNKWGLQWVFSLSLKYTLLIPHTLMCTEHAHKGAVYIHLPQHNISFNIRRCRGRSEIEDGHSPHESNIFLSSVYCCSSRIQSWLWHSWPLQTARPASCSSSTSWASRPAGAGRRCSPHAVCTWASQTGPSQRAVKKGRCPPSSPLHSPRPPPPEPQISLSASPWLHNYAAHESPSINQSLSYCRHNNKTWCPYQKNRLSHASVIGDTSVPSCRAMQGFLIPDCFAAELSVLCFVVSPVSWSLPKTSWMLTKCSCGSIKTGKT